MPRRRELTEEEKAKKRDQYAAKREELRAYYAANKEVIQARRRDNREVKRLEEFKAQLYEAQKSTKSLEIKQFIALVIMNPALYNITKDTVQFLQSLAAEFPYTNGSTAAVHDALDSLRTDAETAAMERGRFINELVYESEEEEESRDIHDLFHSYKELNIRL